MQVRWLAVKQKREREHVDVKSVTLLLPLLLPVSSSSTGAADFLIKHCEKHSSQAQTRTHTTQE